MFRKQYELHFHQRADRNIKKSIASLTAVYKLYHEFMVRKIRGIFLSFELGGIEKPKD